MERGREIVIIAGPNGAGKTTFALEYLSKEAEGLPFINADEIAAELSLDDPDSVAIRAGRVMVETIRESVRSEKSFAFETTLSGIGYAHSIPTWQVLGYNVILLFLSLPNSEAASARVAARVAAGGHSVPQAAIRRRFRRGWENFHGTYKELVDTWFLYDNSEVPPVLIEAGGKQ